MNRFFCVILSLACAAILFGQTPRDSRPKTKVKYDVVAQRHCDPREVPLKLIRQQLTGIGHIVPEKEP
jgi:hypothetical protein